MGFQKDGDLDNSLISLDDFRIRSETAFETHPVAYVEAVWGKDTMAFNAAIQDLEAMRRGLEGELRPPETYHEVQHLVLHIRAWPMTLLVILAWKISYMKRTTGTLAFLLCLRGRRDR